MQPSEEITLSKGEILYREGDANDCIYVIESGQVVLFSTSTGVRIDCERRGSGSILGELSILTDRPRAVTVEALMQCKLHKISAPQIMERFGKLDPILRACVATSINFSATFSAQSQGPGGNVPLATSTLENSDALISQLKLENDVTHGLERGEFSLVYQPIIRLLDGSITGVEALMRWDHPDFGHIAPERFILLAETIESIGRLTENAISETCAMLHRIREKTPSYGALYASVNVSAQDICRDDFVDFVALALDRHALTPDSLRLEVTETALIQEPGVADRTLRRLRSLGCGISVDDFGTGYSNLAYLKTLPLTALKIDRTFAGDAHSNAVSRSIVRMLVGLGAEMEVEIIAEGLETASDAVIIEQLGCSYAQGYHFHRPLSEPDLLDLLANERSAQSDVA